MTLRTLTLAALLSLVAAAPAVAQDVTTGSVGHNWSVVRGKTKVLQLTAHGFNRPGVRVRVFCNGKGCPFKSKTVAVKGGQAKAAKLFRRKRLRSGLSVSVLFAAPGTIGRYVVFTTRKTAIPSVKSACGTFDTTIPTGCVGPAGPQGPRGANGAPGARGPAGPQGPTGIFGSVVTRAGASFLVNRNGFQTGVAACLTSERATGGGVYANTNVYFPSVVASFPVLNASAFAPPASGVTATAWRVWVANNDTVAVGAAPSTVTMTPYVICAG